MAKNTGDHAWKNIANVEAMSNARMDTIQAF